MQFYCACSHLRREMGSISGLISRLEFRNKSEQILWTFVGEQPVADVLEHARLLGVEQVVHGHGGVEQLGLEQTEQPRLGGRAFRVFLFPAQSLSEYPSKYVLGFRQGNCITNLGLCIRYLPSLLSCCQFSSV